MDEDVTRDLPAEFAAVLQNHSVIVPQDASVFRLIAQWTEAPSATVSVQPTLTTEAILSAVPVGSADPTTPPSARH